MQVAVAVAVAVLERAHENFVHAAVLPAGWEGGAGVADGDWGGVDGRLCGHAPNLARARHVIVCTARTASGENWQSRSPRTARIHDSLQSFAKRDATEVHEQAHRKVQQLHIRQ